MSEEEIDLTMDAAGLEAIVRDAMAYVYRSIDGTSQFFAPSVIVHGKDFTSREPQMLIYVINARFDEADEKIAAMQTVGNKIYRAQIIPMAAVLCSDAWLAVNVPDDVMPRDCPDRREAIVVAGQTLGGKHHALTSMPYTRNAAGAIVAGEFMEIGTKGEASLVAEVWRGFAKSFRHFRIPGI